MSRDQYNVKKAGAVGPGATSYDQRRTSPISWVVAVLVVVTVVVGGAGGYFFFSTLPETSASHQIVASNANDQPSVLAEIDPEENQSLTGHSSAEERLALVIHQSDYSGNLSPLPTTRDEAQLVRNALEQAAGFEVQVAENLSKTGLQNTLRDFRRRLAKAGPEAIGFVYYTGHGAQHPRSRNSYLLGVEADIDVASDLVEFGVDLSALSEQFGAVDAKAVFLVFDACRNTPGVSDFMTTIKGLNAVPISSDMLVAYSTGLNDVARVGVYAPVLADELSKPGVKIGAVFAEIQTRVAQDTDRVQLPWYNNQIYEDICFAGC